MKKMITFNAYVVEIESDNCYEVHVEDVVSIIVRGDGFESALVTCVELVLSDDYEIQFVSECDGGSCHRYVVAIDNGD